MFRTTNNCSILTLHKLVFIYIHLRTCFVLQKEKTLVHSLQKHIVMGIHVRA
jgi:hypothetical protein